MRIQPIACLISFEVKTSSEHEEIKGRRGKTNGRVWDLRGWTRLPGADSDSLRQQHVLPVGHGQSGQEEEQEDKEENEDVEPEEDPGWQGHDVKGSV